MLLRDVGLCSPEDLRWFNRLLSLFRYVLYELILCFINYHAVVLFDTEELLDEKELTRSLLAMLTCLRTRVELLVSRNDTSRPSTSRTVMRYLMVEF